MAAREGQAVRRERKCTVLPSTARLMLLSVIGLQRLFLTSVSISPSCQLDSLSYCLSLSLSLFIPSLFLFLSILGTGQGRAGKYRTGKCSARQ